MIYALLGCLFTFLMTSLGAAVVLLCKKTGCNKLNSLFGGFASGVMLAATVWSLLIPGMDYAEKAGVPPVLSTSLGFTLGTLFILLFDRVISRKSSAENKNSALLISAITLHNIPEGMAVGLSFASAAESGDPGLLTAAIALAAGIGIQNFPEGAAVALPLRQQGYSGRKAFLLGSLSGAVEPLFGVLTVLISSYIASYIPWFLSFAAGAMYFAVVKELIPSSCENGKNGSESLSGPIGAALGFLLMMILDISL